MAKFNQTEIERLLSCAKRITEAPRKVMRLEGAYRRNDARMIASDEPIGEFRMFVRQTEDFPENFSIGLVYQSNDERGEMVLIRCNGKHGHVNPTSNPNHPHWAYHVHLATEAALDAGLAGEKYAEKTDEYASLEEALQFFVRRINLNASDSRKYFPSIEQSNFEFLQ